MVYYWMYRTQAENIRADHSIDANQAERIGAAMVGNMGLKKGSVDGLAKAIEKQLQPWAGEDKPEDWPDGYCDKLMDIAESCRRAAK
jgi:zona occludens toxin (predicted ATPase)